MRRRFKVLLSLITAIFLISVSGWFWLLHTASGGRFAWSLAQEKLPGELSAQSIAGDLSSGMKLAGMRYRNDGLQVVVDSIGFAVNVDLIPVAISIVQLDIDKVDLELIDEQPDDASAALSVEDILTAMRMPVELNIVASQLTDLTLRMPDESPRSLLSSLELRATLHDALQIDRLQIASLYVDLSASAHIELQQPFAVQIATDARVNDDMPEQISGVEITASVTGVLDQLDVEMHSVSPEATAAGNVTNVTRHGLSVSDLTVRSEQLVASASSEIDWADGLHISAQTKVAKLDLHSMISTWPETYPLHGAFTASWHGEDIRVSTLEAAVTGTDINVVADGLIDARGGIVDSSLNWRHIKWPLGSKSPVFVSNSGEITISGKRSAWLVDGNLVLQVRDFPEGKLTIKGGGDKNATELAVLDSDILGGNVRGRISYSWRDNKKYTGSLRIDAVQTEPLFSDWPGVLSGQLEIEGIQQAGSFNIEITDVGGKIREKALLASGGVSIAPDALEFRGLNLTHGASVVALDGDIYSTAGVDYELDLDELGEYTDAASGSVQGAGTLSLHATLPRLRANLSAEEIEIGDVDIAELHIEDGATDSNEFLNQRISARNLRIAGAAIDELSVSAIGDTTEHELQIQMLSEHVGASLRATGTLLDWQKPESFGWRGEIEELQFDLPDGLILTLDSPTTFDVSAGSFSLQRACLVADSNADVCLHAEWLKEQSIDAAAELRVIPLSALMVLADTDLDFTQTLSGRFRLSGSGSGPSNAMADIKISAGRMISKLDPSFDVDTGEGLFDFAVVDNTLSSGDLNIPFPEYGEIDVDFGVDDVALGGGGNLSGRVLIDLTDISIIAELLPPIESDGGRLATNLVMGGTVAEPSINGDFNLHDASLYYTPLGTRLTDVQVSANILDTSRINLEANFRAGDGRGRITTSATRQAGAATEFEINGNDLLLVDLPELQVLAEPDVRISIRDKALNIDGRITIPKAHLTPNTAIEDRVTESEDVLVVAGEIPGKEKAADSGTMSINGALQVALGDDVSVNLDLAKARLGGSANFVWQDEIMPIATGVYTVNGTIEAFGQLLTVSGGTIRFPGVPANNPLLRIAAEREIYGNTQVRTAGLMLTGTAKKPILEPYTYPLTTEERALTLLATGSDFDYEQGVGALDFGTYIAPRLYVSYGIGLFEKDNVISARYELKRGFGIKASSGKRDSGIDINYRLEK